jgi:hypothetical protein
MTRPRFACVLMSLTFPILLNGAIGAEPAAPSISLTTPARSAVETDQESISLRGSVTSAAPLASVHWVNQFGQRGAGRWSATSGDSAEWTAPKVALRMGVNLLTVTLVDAGNRSASVHVAVNRKPGIDAPVVPALKLGSGVYQNRPIAYQVWKGHAVIEGDILVDLRSVASPASSQRAVGVPASQQRISPDGLAVNYTAQFWPKVGGVAQVPYIETGSSTNLTTALTAFNQVFHGLIQFVAWSGQANYVNITVEPGGSGEGFSSVGMAGGEQTLDCGSGCTVATWLHEMGHTVGLLHEHQRADRANYITLNLANADLPNVPGNFTLFGYDDQTLGLYDYASVMHYCAFCFSKAGLPVIESIPAGIPLSNDSGYSAGDVDQVERLYGKTPAAVTITTNPVGLNIIVDGVTYPAPQTFSFALNSAHTLALPADPQYTNPADGSTYAFGNWNDLGAASHTIYITPGTGALASPKNKPAVSVYEANYVRLQPFAYLTPAAYPVGSGTVSVTPAPIAEFGGNFYTDRTLVALRYTTHAGYDFYGWFNLPYPQSDNPHSFYIQAPTTSAQAVFLASATPVTIVGESITGPNVWNPLLAGHVDGVFAVLPAGFASTYDGAAWGAGTSHSVAVDQTQSPVTTNVYYNWNTWSDGGALTHDIVQPGSGSQTISASFTPFYASYTLPPPLGSANPSCAGGVTTYPAGSTYPLNPSFGFYGDGTSVMSTATPNPAFPAMVFAGWTGSLSGKLNPQTLTLHDQFVPTANFNLIASPLAISGFTPASATASPTSAPAVTIKGTGFTAGNTYAYWNGSYRALTYVSSTQMTMQLLAGDLTAAGGQDVFVGNYTTNASNDTCGVVAEGSFTVTATGRGAGATTVTLSPATLTFTATQVGSVSAAQTLTLKNTGANPLAIGSIGPQGLNAPSFAAASTTCGATLAAAASCSIDVVFRPTVSGVLTGSLAVVDDATGSPQVATLKGTATAPKVSLTPATLTFASTSVGSTSSSQTVTLKNTGTATLSIASISVGGTNGTSFIVPVNNCGSALAVGASCTLSVALKPTKTGTLTGTLSVADDAAASPQKVTLKGTGM